MITGRAPLRITLGGGGTDLPSYSDTHGGFLVAAAIEHYVHVTVSQRLEPGIVLRHGRREQAAGASGLRHDIVREALLLLGLGDTALEITIRADLPWGTGLGSSGSLCIAMLATLHALRGEVPDWAILAEQAYCIEAERLGQPVGRQDPAIAAHGGIAAFTFQPGGMISAAPLLLTDDTRASLAAGTMLFFTGITRSAGEVLRQQERKSREADPAMIANLHRVKAIGHQSRDLLEAGDLRGFAALMHEQWMLKRERGATSSARIDTWYDLARAHGALGGKLVGAGGGGFMMFFTEDRERLGRGLAETGLTPVPFAFSARGAEIRSR